MMRIVLTLAFVFGMSTAGLTGCNDEAAPPAASTDAQPHDHPHDAEQDHHDDGDDAGHHGGPKHALGEQQAGPYSVQVTQVGEVAAGQPATFEIVLPEEAPQPRAVRAWVGNEQAIGSVKVQAVQRADFYDADLEVPATMPEDSRVWVEVETEDGNRHFASFQAQS